MKPVSWYISREVILNKIKELLKNRFDWHQRGDFINASIDHTRAEALVELLEIADCKLSGGYDIERGQPAVKSVDDRYNWLKSLPGPRFVDYAKTQAIKVAIDVYHGTYLSRESQYAAMVKAHTDSLENDGFLIISSSSVQR